MAVAITTQSWCIDNIYVALLSICTGDDAGCHQLTRVSALRTSIGKRCLEEMQLEVEMRDMTMRRKRILVVDDESSVTRMLKFTLEGTGNYKVRELNCASNVAELARKFKPDLVLLDVMLPDKDGGQIAAELKADPEFEKTPIDFLTAAVEKEEVMDKKGIIGGFHFIAKPIHPKSIVQAIEANLAP